MLTEPYNFATIAAALFPVLLLLHRRPSSPQSSQGSRATQGIARRGFTLVEMIIVVAIVAILVAVALPSYRDHVRKSRRAEAQAYLMALAGRQTQFLIDTRSYAATLATINIPMPSNVAASYDVTLAAAGGPPPTFVLTAAPKPGTDQVSERCGTLTINQTGAKTAAVIGCW